MNRTEAIKFIALKWGYAFMVAMTLLMLVTFFYSFFATNGTGILYISVNSLGEGLFELFLFSAFIPFFIYAFLDSRKRIRALRQSYKTTKHYHDNKEINKQLNTIFKEERKAIKNE
jgi:hypothetical protein